MEAPADRRPAKVRARAVFALLMFIAVAGGLYLWQPDEFYLWAKAFHVIAVISWMAGLLYLPRLFIYHTDAAVGSVQSETFKVMEQRLFQLIMTPAMAMAWTFGLYLAWSVYGFQGGWLHAKLLFVVLLSGFHSYLGGAVQTFTADGPRKSTRHWRLMNEVPTLVMIAVVILVIVKPF